LQGLAALVVASGSFIGSIATLVVQIRTSKVARSNADKLDAQGGQIAEVHAATAAIQEATGTHKTLDGNT
jgi:hypothetical protein